MFLKLEGSKTGQIRGESSDASHGQEIELVHWSWGMKSPSALGGGGAATRTHLSELSVVKYADTASTALMSVMRNNELVKKAVLTVRKSGTKPIDYFVVTIERGRITSFDIESESAETPVLVERIALSFEKINVEYFAQDQTGGKQGGSAFTADVS